MKRIKNQKIKKIFPAIAVVAALAATLVFLRHNLRRADKADYTPVKVERGDLKVTVATTGVIKPQNRVEVKPPLAGRIEEVLVDEGAAVRKGQILGLMSSTDRAVLLDAARSQGEEEVSRWEQMYKPMPIVAPIDGDIIARSVEPGQTVAANEKLFVMSDRLIIQAQIDETDIGRVRLGQTAELTLDAYPAKTIKGIVDAIAYEATTVNNVTMYYVDVLPESTPAFMRSGMTANILIVTATTNGVLTLPTGAVYSSGKETIVWRADPANCGKTINAKIQTGMNDGKKVQIISGLEEGDSVLVASTRFPESKKDNVNPFSPFRRR
ncbi:MAG: efflux RND transporter periplasmic adaptor subunit [Kiritimatiellae bacterium]|nr:efflux RND transporter periplasmic adaptor subunit [Kiritimatiellia bacterium]